MRRILFSFFLLLSAALSAQENGEDQFSIEGFVNRQLQTYPKSRLLDIYKSCFQDYMGAEHLVSDRQRVKASAYSGETLLGEGTHLRFIVDKEKFMSRL
jgi:hypothetical protein